MRTRPNGRLALVLDLALLAAGASPGCLAAVPLRPPQAASPAPTRPNIVVVLTDDLDEDLGSLAYLPKLTALLPESGLKFRNSFVSESLCCPSRASTQRAQYVHNHRVVGNKPPDGGFERFHALREEDSTVGTWLRSAGYRTAYLGKYLNGYPDTAARTFVPPGWDEWASPVAGNAYGEFKYALNENGVLVHYGTAEDDYLTDVLAAKAVRFITQAAKDARPFFLFVATYAPHQPATPAPRYADALPDARGPRSPSYNEPDVSDKPHWIRAKRLLGAREERQMDELYRKRLQSMLAVEDLVERVLDTLRATGQLDRSYVFFTSDNGFHMGEHRLPAGKLTPYDEDIHVPLFVRGPDVPAGEIRDELVGNVDLAPTFAELAGAVVPDFVDGRSLVPLLRNASPHPAWRGALLVEQEEVHFRPRKGAPTRSVPEPLDLLEEEMSALPEGERVSIPGYNALRTPNWAYVAYSTGERELYDVVADPHQLRNLAPGADPALVKRLDAWLDALRKCRGAECRAADLAPAN